MRLFWDNHFATLSNSALNSLNSFSPNNKLPHHMHIEGVEFFQNFIQMVN